MEREVNYGGEGGEAERKRKKGKGKRQEGK